MSSQNKLAPKRTTANELVPDSQDLRLAEPGSLPIPKSRQPYMAQPALSRLVTL
jgi:hypothetical protein